MDIEEVCSVQVFLNSRTTGSFIDQDFVHVWKINTWKIFYPVLVFNVDGSPNKASEISEVVDIVLQYRYKTVVIRLTTHL